MKGKASFLSVLLPLCACVIFSYCVPACADMLVMRDGKELKGVVVEDFKDRIIISMEDGEKQVMRKDIRNIIYDLEEQNLTNLGEYYQDRALYKKSYYYYAKALKVNPGYKKARDGLNYVSTKLRQASRSAKIDYMNRRNEERNWRKGKVTSNTVKKDDKIRENLGFRIKNVKQTFLVTEVYPGTPAARAGMSEGDYLIAIWGRNITYMEPGEVLELLSDPGVMDIKLTILRSYMVELKDDALGNYVALSGMRLGYSEMEGLVVEDVEKGSVTAKAGIDKGDIIDKLQGESTRYMPFEDVTALIRSRKGDTLSLDINRDLAIWKKFTAE